MTKWAAILLLWPTLALAMLEEYGSLHDFLLGRCADCAYDNWLSHVSERLIREDYNDYGPPNLDPVTNGFGSFTLIPALPQGDSTLAQWRNVFEFAVANEWTCVDSMLTRSDADWNYELVRFHETGRRQEYYILRERLDLSFVDANGDTLPGNDVIGGFRKGWGVFVFNPTPRHGHAVIQVPHPEDDYMAPPVATDIFTRAEFAILMIAGAGREVMWDTTFQTYENSRSLSDPSRNRRHPFAIATEVARDAWDTPPVSDFIVVQLHSYDHNEHVPLGDMQVSCFYDDHSPNPPIRDVGLHRDFVHGLPLFPVRGIDGDTGVVTRIDEYLSLWSTPPYGYFGEDTVGLRDITDFIGAPENQQGNYCHAEHDWQFGSENFVHIELDEYPDALWTPTDFIRWLPGGPPATLSNYRLVRDYYSALVTALDSALTWHEVPDTSAPEEVRIREVRISSVNSVQLTWKGLAFDQHFETYEIVYDTTAISESSRRLTYLTPGYDDLADQTRNTIWVSGLIPPLQRYRFAIRARDILGNTSNLTRPWSIIDSTIHDLRIQVIGDSLRLLWTGAHYDSHYEVREYLADMDDYYLIATTANTNFTFAPPSPGPRGASVIMVKRILRE